MLALAMRELSPEDRVVITLQELEGLSVKEICERTGSSSVAVRVRGFRTGRAVGGPVHAGIARAGIAHAWLAHGGLASAAVRAGSSGILARSSHPTPGREPASSEPK